MKKKLRHIYIEWMHRRGKHVRARDCWCNPEIEDYRDG